MKIAIIGTGYVGLVAAVCFADWGHEVVCVGRNGEKIARLREGLAPIFEPGLEAAIVRNLTSGRLSFTLDTAEAVASAEAAFIAVGTPGWENSREANLTSVYAAARQIAEAMTGSLVVVTKSTVPVGTSDAVERIIRDIRPELKSAVVSNPEFLREGAAIGDFLRPDRVVIGTKEAWAEDVLRRIYQPLQQASVPIVVTRRNTAELIKYASNAFLATKIGFINEMADLCEQVGADVTELALGVGLDHRIGKEFLSASPGYGGSCFPKDTDALLHTAHEYGVPMRIVESAVAVNDARKRRMATKIIKAVGGSVDRLTIAVLGLTFKPDTDDMRDAPSVAIIRDLQNAGARISAFDPQGTENAKQCLEGVRFWSDPYDCARDADAVVVMTAWDVVKSLDLDRLRKVMRSPVMVDLHNIYVPEAVQRHGFRLVGVGRPDQLTSITRPNAYSVPEPQFGAVSAKS